MLTPLPPPTLDGSPISAPLMVHVPYHVHVPYLFLNPVSHENAFAFYFSLVVRFAALRRALPNVSKVAFPASVRHFRSGSIFEKLFLPFALTWYMYRNPYRCSESLKKIN